MKDEIKKNIKDLEYNNILNKQNFFLITFATATISVMLAENIPDELTKGGLILAFVLGIILVLLYYGDKLRYKIKEIEKI